MGPSQKEKTETAPGGNAMLNWLDKLPYPLLLVASVLVLLAPIKPMPHILEKHILLKMER